MPPNPALQPIKVEGSGPIFDGVVAACGRAGYRVTGSGDCALFVLANVQRIVPEREFSAPPLGTLCFHPSLLPRHRGGDAVYWTLKMGDTETGVTWFWVTRKVDAGPIAIQRRITIPSPTRPRELYEQHLVPLGISSFQALLAQLERGEVPRQEQDEALATYEPLRPKVT